MHPFEESPTPEKQEKLWFKVTLMRHEEPYYRDEGHDLTPSGVEKAKAAGQLMREIGHISEEDELYLIYSPKPRARGTLEFVAEGAAISHDSKRMIRQLRASDIPDQEKFMERVIELGRDQEAVAKDHHTNIELYENNPAFIEPTSKKKQRLYRAFEYLIRTFKNDPPEKIITPHVIAVSHFEIITHFIDDVFGIENIGRYNAPSFGEAVHIEAYKTENPDTVRLKVSFQEHSKEVLFNRKNRAVEVK